jgi:hypothetical protein
MLSQPAGDGFVTRSEFERLYRAILPKAQPGNSDRAFAALDLEGNGKVDIVSWSHRMRLADMPAMVERIRRHGAWGVGGVDTKTACSSMGVSWKRL